MENQKNNIENEEDEDEETILRRLIDETYKKIEESKKTITNRIEELKKETEKGIRYEMIIKEKKEEIAVIDESIKIINDKMGETYKEKKFIDVLKNRRKEIYDDCIFETLQYIRQAEANQEALNWVQDWEVINSEKILRTEKLKLMKYLGHFFESAEKLFDIDNISFNNMQHKIEKIFAKEEQSKESSADIKVTSTINIKIYFKEFLTREEVDKKLIEIDKNDSTVFNLSIIEYNYLYEITNKHKLIALKSLACKYFSLEEDTYMFVDETFTIWPFDVCLYDEIMLLNLEKGYIKHHAKFYNLNPAVTENLKFILIHKRFMIELCMDRFENFRFVQNSNITKQCK
jgi:hypothetical protein